MGTEPTGIGPSFHKGTAVTIGGWRQTAHGRDMVLSGILAKDNGATVPSVFGMVKSGTVLGKITASSKYRPCFKAAITATVTAALVIEVGADALAAVFVGDVVGVYLEADGSQIATGRNVVSMDTVAGTITVDGANITAAIGDVVRLEDGAQIAKGIADRTTSTKFWDDSAQEEGSQDVPISIGWHGWGRTALMTGWNTLVAADLPLLVVTD